MGKINTKNNKRMKEEKPWYKRKKEGKEGEKEEEEKRSMQNRNLGGEKERWGNSKHEGIINE